MYYCPSHKYLTSYRKTVLSIFLCAKCDLNIFFCLVGPTVLFGFENIGIFVENQRVTVYVCDRLCTTQEHFCPLGVSHYRCNETHIIIQPKCHKSFADHHAWEFAMPLHVGMNPYWNSAPLNVRIFAFQSNQKHELGRYSNYRKYVANQFIRNFTTHHLRLLGV